MGTFVNPFDVTKPLNGDLASSGDDQIRTDKAALLERLLVEHDFPVGLTGSGRHKIPFGTTAARPADPVAGTIYINTQTTQLEYYTGSAWANVISINLAAYLLLAGGTMSGHLILNNAIAVKGKDTGAVARNLVSIDAANQILVGDVARRVILSDATSAQRWTGAVLHKIWDAGNDGDNSGLDTDLIKGKDVTLLYDKVGTDGYMYFTELNGPFIQWGVTAVGASATVTVTLPVAYAGAHLVAVGSQANDVDLDGSVGAIPFSLSQIKLFNNNSSSGVTMDWLSVGY